MSNTTSKPATSFWIISVIALLWNLIGVIVYLGQAFMTDAMKAAIPKEQLSIIENTPAWATAAFAVAVWFGLLASILLLSKKQIAKILFMFSLIGVLVQLIYNLLMTNAIEVYGTASLIQPIITVSISVFLVWYSKKCADDGILS
jgi:hypothetical protein